MGNKFSEDYTSYTQRRVVQNSRKQYRLSVEKVIDLGRSPPRPKNYDEKFTERVRARSLATQHNGIPHIAAAAWLMVNPPISIDAALYLEENHKAADYAASAQPSWQ